MAGPGERLEVGHIAKAHGLHGEVVVVPLSNRPERFAAGSVLYLDGERRVVQSSRPHQDRFLVRFEGVDDRDGAERLRGRTLTGDPLGDAAEDEVWVHELIGARVRDRSGRAIGAVVAVEANPAHDLLVLDTGALIPIVFVVERHERDVVVELPEGLLELYQ
jgi:16S rRNA processing protein RimM